MEKKRVLCVCAGNTARSVMVAAMLRRLGFEVESAGTDETADGHPADDLAIACMKERRLDVSSHRGRWVGHVDLTQFSHIVCVNWKVKQAVLEFLPQNSTVKILIPGERGIPLLPGGGLAEYEECAALLDKVIPEIAKTIMG